MLISFLYLQPLGAISSNKTHYTYDVPSRKSLLKSRNVDVTNGSVDVTLTFSIFSISSPVLHHFPLFSSSYVFSLD